MKIEKAYRCTLRQVRLDEDVYNGQIDQLIGTEGALILMQDRGRRFFEFHAVTHTEEDNRFRDQIICGEVHAVMEEGDRITVGTEYVTHFFDIIEQIPKEATGTIQDAVHWIVSCKLFDKFMDGVVIEDV